MEAAFRVAACTLVAEWLARWQSGQGGGLLPVSRAVGLPSLIIGCLSLLGISCDPGYPKRIGVLAADDGHLTILFAPCEDDIAIRRIQLVPSGRSDETLWEIRNPDPIGSGRLKFHTAEEPPDFETTRPLLKPLLQGRYVVRVDSSFQDDQTLSFELSDVSKSSVFTGTNAEYSIEEFEAGALCD